jgi:subtilisin family serine protease
MWVLIIGLSVQVWATQKIVTLSPGIKSRDKISDMQSIGGKFVRELKIINALVFQFPDSLKDEKIFSISGVVNVEEDKYFKWIESDEENIRNTPFPTMESVMEKINPPDFEQIIPADVWTDVTFENKLKTTDEEKEIPWGVKRVNAPKAWGTLQGEKVKVAVIDTGVDYTHPEIAPNYVGGYNAISTSTLPMDDHGHGTHVSGTIGAIKDAKGVVGVAPKVSIYGVKVLDKNGSGTYSDVIAGIEWAANNKMNVINMSLGGRQGTDSLKKVIEIAYKSGITIVCAAGNDSGAVNYPAKYDESLAISASNSSDGLAYFSSRGPEIDFIAPGVSIYSTYKGGGYKTMSGTSMASPHMAGLAALVVGMGITKPEEVKNVLTKAAVSLNLPPEKQGAGLVDAGKLIANLRHIALAK